ncbi:MAG: hypothetical protein Q8O59_04140 [bacterium]|nr:hypothetical protein [bacterium]
MDALFDYLDKVDWRLYILGFLMIFVCVGVPIKGLIDDLWRTHSKKEE